MINERLAVVLLDGVVVPGIQDPHYTRQFYRSLRSFAEASLRLCDEGRFQKLEQFLKVALKLFKYGNETVKNGVVNVYLYTLSQALDRQREARRWIEPFMPQELRFEYARLHYVSGV
jgi:hypothetical protein